MSNYAESDSPGGMSRRVLIIEDNAQFARVLERYLTLFGHEIETALDGTTGLEKVRQFSPDIVICDIRLPDMDGWSIAHQLNDSSRFQRPALIIALTGFGGGREKRQSERAGFDVHINKPPDMEKLEQVVSSLSVEPFA